jgi:hypothetical protein
MKDKFIIRNKQTKTAFEYTKKQFDGFEDYCRKIIDKDQCDEYQVEYYWDDTLMETAKISDYFN